MAAEHRDRATSPSHAPDQACGSEADADRIVWRPNKGPLLWVVPLFLAVVAGSVYMRVVTGWEIVSPLGALTALGLMMVMLRVLGVTVVGPDGVRDGTLRVNHIPWERVWAVGVLRTPCGRAVLL